MRKKGMRILLLLTAISVSIVACVKEETFKKDNPIHVISREDGSGTKGSFGKTLSIQERFINGDRIDLTTKEADVASQTNAVIHNVKEDEYSIGYISLAALREDVKALSIDGVEPSVENIKNGKYKVFRNLNLVIKKGNAQEEVIQDFLSFLFSEQADEIIQKNGFFSINEKPGEYTARQISGRLVIIGSTSIAPLMEKVKEVYESLNPGIDFQVQEIDSTVGIQSVKNDICQIGMVSRELEEEELKGIEVIPIAADAIAVIVNQKNPIENVTQEEVEKIFKGQFVRWDFK